MENKVEFQKRVRLVLREIMQKEGMSAESLAKSLEIDTGALDDFLNLRSIFEAEDIVRLNNLYDVNMLWVYTGKESPFYQNGERPIEMEEDAWGAVRNAASAGEFELTPEEKLDCLAKAATILASKKPSAEMLAMMVEAYDRIVKLEKENKELRRTLAAEKERTGLV